MKLLTKEIEKRLPKRYSSENITTQEKVIQCKFFTPFSNWTWYCVEYCPEDRTFFGLVHGFEKEWGYFSLDELQALADLKPGKVERDRYFQPCKVKDLRD